jgi:GxxExxY protein
MDIEAAAREIVDAGFQVHKALGPGLLESTYEICFVHELLSRGLVVRKQVPLPITYKGVRLESGFRLDLVVEERIIVEIKAVDALARVHEAQILSYMRLSGLKLGFPMNFNVELFKNGVRRFVD